MVGPGDGPGSTGCKETEDETGYGQGNKDTGDDVMGEEREDSHILPPL